MTKHLGRKKKLIEGLNKQKKLMLENAELMEAVCPQFYHHTELFGAADITQTWIDGIKKAA